MNLVLQMNRTDTVPALPAPRVRRMAAGRALSWRTPAGGEVLQITAGRAWVTVEGDPSDYILETGESMQLPSRRLVVVEGM